MALRERMGEGGGREDTLSQSQCLAGLVSKKMSKSQRRTNQHATVEIIFAEGDYSASHVTSTLIAATCCVELVYVTLGFESFMYHN